MNILKYKVLMQRTLKNLDYIKQNDSNEPGPDGESPAQTDVPPYAVTQRVNSYLGAFAHVYDKTLLGEYKKEKKVFHPARNVPPNWPSFDSSDEAPGLNTIAPNAGEYCRRVRNALAHGQVEFEANGDEISLIHLWTKSKMGTGDIEWGGSLSVADFEKFLREFCKFIEDTFDDDGKAKPVRCN